MAFATAIVTAFLIDFRPPQGLPAKYHRWLEAAMQAAVTVLAAFLVHWWLGELAAKHGEKAPPLFSVLIVSATVGFVLGFIVPTWYRRAQMAEPRTLSVVRAQDTGPNSDRAAVAQSS